ncbi:MAG: hypothetical protein AB7I37_01730 [Pirellulales bacterium]
MRNYILLAGLWLLAAAVPANSQEPPPNRAATKPEPVKQPAAEPAKIEEALPPIHLMNKDGKLVPVPGVTLEEFQALLTENTAQPDRGLRPRYIIQSITATGVAAGRQVAISCQFKILTNENGWTRIPLRFPEGIVEEQPEYTGEGKHFLDYDTDGGGYVSWIRGEGGSTHQLNLKLIVPMLAGDLESRFKLTAPRSTQSELKLQVPGTQQVGKLAGGAILDAPLPGASPNATEFVLRRLDGEFDFSWRPASEASTEARAEIEASCVIATRIDGTSIRHTANLVLRSLGGDFRAFDLYLPRGAKLVESEHVGYRVNDPAVELPNNEPRRIEVILDQPTNGSIECRIVADQLHHPTRSDEFLDLSGFAVVDAARQSGHVGVYAVGDWQVLWGPLDSGARRVEKLPAGLSRDDLAACFEFSRQPYALPARVVPRETRIHVDPEYLFLVGVDQVRMEARWKYKVRGAKAFAIEIDMPGWEVDELGPDNLVLLDEISTSEASPLTIPLLQPATGPFEIVLHARRPMPESGELDLTVPIPRANTSSPAAIVILPEDNVEVRPRPDKMAGLYRQHVAPPMQLPARQQEPLFFRGEAAQARFAADLTRRPQEITVRVESVVKLKDAAGFVEQRLSYHVTHERLTTILVQAPKQLAEQEDLRFELNGERLLSRLQSDADSESPLVRMQLELPSPKIGDFEVVVGYSLERQELAPETTALRAVPLVVPMDGELERHDLMIEPAAGIRAELREDRWTETAHSAKPRLPNRTAAFCTSTDSSEVRLAVNLDDRSTGGQTTIERAWVQTWLSSAGRMDRVLYRLTSSQASVLLTLPVGCDFSTMQLVLDGEQVEASASKSGEIEIPLNRPQTAGEASSRLLEIQYHFSRAQRSGELALSAPAWPDDCRILRTYWQLILPRHQHLVAGPRNMTSEQNWAWSGLGWERTPLLNQSQLEQWIGAPQHAMPPGGVNCYLFGALSGSRVLDVRLAGRSLIVFTFSLVALGMGLMVIYLPALRRAGVLLSLAMGLAAWGLIYPDQAVLASQAAVIGIVLAALAGWLERSTTRRRPARGETSHGSSSILKSRVVELNLMPPGVPAPNSTMTAPLVVVPPDEDSGT